MSERRIIVEVTSPEVVKRLEDEIARLEAELKDYKGKHESLHRTVYRLMETVGELRRSLGKS